MVGYRNHHRENDDEDQENVEHQYHENESAKIVIGTQEAQLSAANVTVPNQIVNSKVPV